MQSLFPMPAGRGGANPTPLVTFKAGKCAMVAQPDGKFLVTPDTRRGKVVVIRTADGLLHFRWANRVNNEVEDDRIIFPGDAEFKKVKTGRDIDRVYILSFQTGLKFMFWLQDIDASKDAENVKKVNDAINNVSTAPAGTAAAPGGPADFARMLGAPAAGPVNPASLGGLDLSSILGAFNSAPVAPATSSSVPAANNRLTAEHLQQALAGSSAQPVREVPPRLEEILTTDAILNSGVLNDPSTRAELVAQLPEGQQSDEFLEDNIRSAQFQQSLGALSDVILSDGGSGVTTSFGINPAPGTAELIQGDAVGAFLTSVQAQEQPLAADTSAGAEEPAAVEMTPGESETDNNEPMDKE